MQILYRYLCTSYKFLVYPVIRPMFQRRKCRVYSTTKFTMFIRKIYLLLIISIKSISNSIMNKINCVNSIILVFIMRFKIRTMDNFGWCPSWAAQRFKKNPHIWSFYSKVILKIKEFFKTLRYISVHLRDLSFIST